VDCDGGEEADNGDDDHDLNQREPTLFVGFPFHNLTVLLFVASFTTGPAAG
jgi:hypothetical protein